MIINDKEIRKLAKDGFISPFHPDNLKNTYIPSQLDSNSYIQIRALSYGTSSFGYDFTLADDVYLFTADYRSELNVKNFDKDKYTEKLEVYVDNSYGKYVILPPHSFVLGHTMEYVKMPDNLLGICFDKSTYARIGGIQTNVTPIEPGWHGQITLEIRNTLPCFTRLYVEEGIIQTVFFKGDRPGTTYADKGGKYQGQRNVTGSIV